MTGEGEGDDLRIPVSTYRLQVSPELPLQAAAELVPYLAALGISHLYSSPLLQARRGSPHGYDVADPSRIDEERGGEAGFAELSSALARHGMGLLLDIVPNHLLATPENPWWRDLLAHGKESPFARCFDVDWDAPGLDGKVLVPVLGEPYGEALAAGDLRLVAEEGEVVVAYHDRRFPLAPGTAPAVESLAALDAAAVDEVLGRQRYRLAFWRLGNELLDYRRFFDVDELAGVRVEDRDVLEATHRRIFGLWREGRVHGLRIDHIDGLSDPAGYLATLRERLLAERDPGGDPYVVVEKILAGDEELPAGWACHGTTGYDAVSSFHALFVEPSGLAALDSVWRTFTGVDDRFVEMRRDRKRQVVRELFGAELGRLVRQLAGLATAHRTARDLPRRALVEALAEVTAALPVYRTYATPAGPGESDRRWLGEAFAAAGRRAAGDPLLPPALDFLREVLELRVPAYLGPEARHDWFAFVARWQQQTGAVMAKGMEDTTLYLHARLISLNDVGSEPPGTDPPGSLRAYHRRNEARRARWPAALTATSTHDSKRGEDVASRIQVLAELPEEWEARLLRWSDVNEVRRRALPDGRVAPDRNEEVFIYQTLLGAWPLAREDRADFPDRMTAYLRKALREAKTHSSWLAPDEVYETAVLGFVDDLLAAPGGDPFLADFRPFAEEVAAFGAWGSLARLLLQVAAPGVPDFYRGTELWDLSLVDPDNRRPVDFERRRALLGELQGRWCGGEGERAALLCELLREWTDGRVKLFATWRALAARRADVPLFLHGDYQPVLAEGARAAHLVAFARRWEDRWLLAVAPRWVARLVEAPAAPLGERVWGETWLPLPAGAPAAWRDAFSDETVVAEGGRIGVGTALARFPVAMLRSIAGAA